MSVSDMRMFSFKTVQLLTIRLIMLFQKTFYKQSEQHTYAIGQKVGPIARTIGGAVGLCQLYAATHHDGANYA